VGSGITVATVMPLHVMPLLGAANKPGPPAFWLILGGISAAIAVTYAVIWLRSRNDGNTYRNRRYQIAMWGLFAWAVFCFARAATL
jgi:NhaP-type Na+/H+ or K+/H+ antiporter